MRNRAKCAECKTILESLAFGDVVTCTCGLQTIWGGTQALHSTSKDYTKFLRVDDEGGECPVMLIDGRELEKANGGKIIIKDAHIGSGASLEPLQSPIDPAPVPSIPSSTIDELQAFKEYLDKWPSARLHSSCTYADLRDLSSLVLAVLKSPPL